MFTQCFFHALCGRSRITAPSPHYLVCRTLLALFQTLFRFFTARRTTRIPSLLSSCLSLVTVGSGNTRETPFHGALAHRHSFSPTPFALRSLLRSFTTLKTVRNRSLFSLCLRLVTVSFLYYVGDYRFTTP